MKHTKQNQLGQHKSKKSIKLERGSWAGRFTGLLGAWMGAIVLVGSVMSKMEQLPSDGVLGSGGVISPPIEKSLDLDRDALPDAWETSWALS